jgi:transcriptional regulator with XRE-family HTH domain
MPEELDKDGPDDAQAATHRALCRALGVAIREARTSRGKTRKEVAIAVCDGSATEEGAYQWLYQVEAHGVPPAIKRLLRLSREIDTSLWLLFLAAESTILGPRARMLARVVMAANTLPDETLAQLAGVAEQMRALPPLPPKTPRRRKGEPQAAE